VFVDLAAKPEWFFPLNPYGRVPTLAWAEGGKEESLYEVGARARWPGGRGAGSPAKTGRGPGAASSSARLQLAPAVL
jgi:hypothetical protein